MKTDATSPNHYTRFKIQPLDFILANGIGFAEGNVIKYVCRYDAKNGLEDLRKARTYLDRLIAARENKEKVADYSLVKPLLPPVQTFKPYSNRCRCVICSPRTR